MKSIDCKGLACPTPVLTTKEAIEREGLNELTIIVDNEAAKENVTRFLESQNFEVSAEGDGGDFNIVGIKKVEEACQVLSYEKPEAVKQKIMVMVTSDCMGRGDDKLGSKLMSSFLKTLKEMGDDLWRLVYVNNGVKLTIDGSPVLSDLKDLEVQEIHILVCGTCLTHFNLLDKKQVGETTNMLDIITAMQLADKVINL